MLKDELIQTVNILVFHITQHEEVALFPKSVMHQLPKPSTKPYRNLNMVAHVKIYIYLDPWTAPATSTTP